MTELPLIPTSPHGFVALMEQIWADHSKPTGDGGLRLYTSIWYDDWHDAIKVAKTIGLERTGGSKRDGVNGQIYRFPNGEGVFIHSNGSGVSARTSRFAAKMHPSQD